MGYKYRYIEGVLAWYVVLWRKVGGMDMIYRVSFLGGGVKNSWED